MKIRIGSTAIDFECVERIEYVTMPEAVTLYFVSGATAQFNGSDAAKIWNWYVINQVEFEL